MKQLFVDSGGWYAIADRKDPDHADAVSFLTSNVLPLLTTNFIFDEAVTLMRSRIGWEAASEFGRKIRSGSFVNMVDVTPEDQERAWAIFLRYRDHAFSFTDCTSFAVMERMKIETAFSYDGHFKIMKFNILPGI